MKRPWKFIIEVGGSDSPGAITASNQPGEAIDVIWPMLVESRKALVEQIKANNETRVGEINQWLGGALAVAGTLVSTPAEVLRDRLIAEIPTPAAPNPYGHLGDFKNVEHKRPERSPNAPRPIDPNDLTQEERDELGIVLPGDDNGDV